MHAPGNPLIVAATRYEAGLFLGDRARHGHWKELADADVWSGSGLGGYVGVTGVGVDRARQGMESLLISSRDISTVVGIGFAGGIHPEAKAGDLVIPSEISANGGSICPEPALRRSLSAFGLGKTWSRLATCEDFLTSARSKEELFRNTGVEAVDMESAAWGEVCRNRGIPWAIVRSILDRADEEIPLFLGEAVDARGRTRPSVVARWFLRPSRILILLRWHHRSRAIVNPSVQSVVDGWLSK